MSRDWPSVWSHSESGFAVLSRAESPWNIGILTTHRKMSGPFIFFPCWSQKYITEEGVGCHDNSDQKVSHDIHGF